MCFTLACKTEFTARDTTPVLSLQTIGQAKEIEVLEIGFVANKFQQLCKLMLYTQPQCWIEI